MDLNNQLRERGIERPIFERQRLRHRPLNSGSRHAIPGGRHGTPPRDRRRIPDAEPNRPTSSHAKSSRATADIKHAVAVHKPREIDEHRCQGRRVSPHETVVLLGTRHEAHRADSTQVPATRASQTRHRASTSGRSQAHLRVDCRPERAAQPAPQWKPHLADERFHDLRSPEAGPLLWRPDDRVAQPAALDRIRPESDRPRTWVWLLRHFRNHERPSASTAGGHGGVTAGPADAEVAGRWPQRRRTRSLARDRAAAGGVPVTSSVRSADHLDRDRCK